VTCNAHLDSLMQPYCWLLGQWNETGVVAVVTFPWASRTSSVSIRFGSAPLSGLTST